MYGLPKDADLRFLQGAELLQLCVGCHEIIANFFGDISITIQSPFILRVANEKRISPSDLPAGAAPLLSLVGTKIEKVAYDTSGRLELFFSNSKILILLDDSNDHESYTISHGDDLIVV